MTYLVRKNYSLGLFEEKNDCYEFCGLKLYKNKAVEIIPTDITYCGTDYHYILCLPDYDKCCLENPVLISRKFLLDDNIFDKCFKLLKNNS